MNYSKLFFQALATMLLFTNPAFSESGFFTPKDFPLGGISKQIATEVSEKVLTKNKTCVFIPIGKDKVLTALHCMQGQTVFGNIEMSDHSGLILTLNQDLAPPSILASGGSFPFIYEQLIDGKHWKKSDIDLYKNAYLSDWVILSFKTGLTRCFQVDEYPSSDNLLIAGFPGRAVRPNHSSIGSSIDVATSTAVIPLLLSYGPSVRSVKSNPYIQSLPKSTQQVLSDVIDSSVERNSLMLIDADSQHGDSGGPIVSNSGRLVGMLIAGLVDGGVGNQYKYIENSALGISIRSIQEQLHEDGLNPGNFFNCDSGEQNEKH